MSHAGSCLGFICTCKEKPDFENMEREERIRHILKNANMQPYEEDELREELAQIVAERDEELWLDKCENDCFERMRERE
jgi:hypothetical protein